MSDLIRVLTDPESSLRDVYDYLVDYLSELGCFVSGFSGKPCMFEAYGTVIEFSRVAAALQSFDKPQVARLAAALNETNFTPLAPVLAAYLSAASPLSPAKA